MRKMAMAAMMTSTEAPEIRLRLAKLRSPRRTARPLIAGAAVPGPTPRAQGTASSLQTRQAPDQARDPTAVWTLPIRSLGSGTYPRSGSICCAGAGSGVLRKPFVSADWSAAALGAGDLVGHQHHGVGVGDLVVWSSFERQVVALARHLGGAQTVGRVGRGELNGAAAVVDPGGLRVCLLEEGLLDVPDGVRGGLQRRRDAVVALGPLAAGGGPVLAGAIGPGAVGGGRQPGGEVRRRAGAV